MISLFVFSISVLGFAALQSRAVQATFDNSQRDQIVWITQSLIDRIRGNDAATQQYVSELTNFNNTNCPKTTPTQPICDTPTTKNSKGDCNNCCKPTEMAQFDVWDLYCRSDFQGAKAVKGLSVNLSCPNATTTTGTTTTTCTTEANLQLTHSWCARTLESDGGNDNTNLCDNSAPQSTYTVAFRP